MNIYSRKSTWKFSLAVAGLIVLLVAMFYTSFLANKLAEGERLNAQLVTSALEELTKYPDDLDKDLNLALNIIESNTKIPIIVVDERDSIKISVNFIREDKEYLREQLEKIRESGQEPISIQFTGVSQRAYYKSSTLLDLITYFPLVMMLLLGTFVFFGYLGFSASRKAEQNQVWVGMAKETAHQLGTPISAIVAWIEHLRGMSQHDEEKLEILDELDNDVKRLDLIADRFSKIGSAPNLERINIYRELEKSRQYMQRRAARKVVFDFPDPNQPPAYAQINAHLFSWVLENLLRNSLDAMDGKGTIAATVKEKENNIIIDISDSGKGIPASKFKSVFQPGYTTKKRGWGLGLSLTKRIIEHYHKGKIFVKKSELGQGTTFTIVLPAD